MTAKERDIIYQIVDTCRQHASMYRYLNRIPTSDAARQAAISKVEVDKATFALGALMELCTRLHINFPVSHSQPPSPFSPDVPSA